MSRLSVLLLLCACGKAKPTVGTVSGTITTTAGGVLAGVTVTLTPTKGAAAASAVASANGSFSFANVPLLPGTGTIALSTLPGPCTAPAPIAYKGVNAVKALVVPVIVTCATPTDATGLWMGGQFAYDASALSASGAPLATDICPPAVATSGAEAFDGNGNLWTQLVSDQTNDLVEWTAAQLAGACSASLQPAITLTVSGGAAGGMAFDAQGTLWVTDSDNLTVRGFIASQLTATASLTPTYALEGAAVQNPVIQTPQGLAVDASGNLWIANGLSILEYAPQTLAQTNDANVVDPVPDGMITTAENQVTLGAPAQPVYPQLEFQQLAFDSAGDLWVTALRQVSASSATTVLLQYPASAIAGVGVSHTPVATVAIAPSDTHIAFGALAFDGSGNLWVGAYAATGPNLFRYPAAALPNGGPFDIAIRGPVSGFGVSLAFTPLPAGLPIRAR